MGTASILARVLLLYKKINKGPVYIKQKLKSKLATTAGDNFAEEEEGVVVDPGDDGEAEPPPLAAAAVVLTESFIPPVQWPGTPHMK
ncbi:hypothetical protein ACJIZ3_019203 [Penstemon smallii]|uniref:Uncharacterized protein n=1 Tax=Penstemon smallii TaxID=265156 RepID=A0ABD3T179_9LAMI